MPLTFSSSTLGTPRRGQTYAVLKSLVNMDRTSSAASALPGQAENAGQIVINFPCMPDTIELARRANYTNEVPSPITPDGFYLYNHTEPLSIPISFSLHGFDRDYCRDSGPYMLLSIAAKLHALTMPLHKGGRLSSMSSASAVPAQGQGAAPAERPASVAGPTAAAAVGVGTVAAAVAIVNSKFAYPPPCVLNIMLAQVGGYVGSVNQSNDGVSSLGINCHGFVTDVRAVFKGPWLQGNLDTGDIRNMPSSAEFSFTFVHQPGYSNVLGEFGVGTGILTTTARDIYQRLYNTADLSDKSRIDYAGLNTPFEP